MFVSLSVHTKQSEGAEFACAKKNGLLMPLFNNATERSMTFLPMQTTVGGGNRGIRIE